MKGLNILLGMGLLMVSLVSRGDEAPSHPLDAEAKRCLLTHPEAVTLAYCYADLVDEWRDEVERVYEFVLNRKLKQGKREEARLIQQEQNNWLKYRSLVASSWGKNCAENAACQVELPKLELAAQRQRYFQLLAYIDCTNCFAPYEG